MKGKSLIHYLKYIAGVDKPYTQTSLYEQKALMKYASRSKSIAEIGVFEGVNTCAFALSSPADAIIYAIDPFFKANLGISYGKLIALHTWGKNSVTNKIKIFEGLSWDVYPLINHSLDFIFIDADHSFAAVKRDFELYSEKLSANGVIAFHDAKVFSGGWVEADWGPVQLIDEIKKNRDWKIIEEVDSTVFIQRT